MGAEGALFVCLLVCLFVCLFVFVFVFDGVVCVGRLYLPCSPGLQACLPERRRGPVQVPRMGGAGGAAVEIKWRAAADPRAPCGLSARSFCALEYQGRV